MPKVLYYKPFGIPLKDIKIVTITITEYESLKLKDYENNSQIDSAVMMKVSQPTFNRIYNNAKKKLIKAIIEGLAVKIEGGNYKMPNNDRTGPLGHGPMTGRKMGYCGTNNRNLNNQTNQRLRLNRKQNWAYSQSRINPNIDELSKEKQKQYIEEELNDLNTYKEELEQKLKNI